MATSRDAAGEARRALERLRAYTSTRSATLTAAVDKLSAFVDSRDRASKPATAADAEGEPTWRQPPSFEQARSADSKEQVTDQGKPVASEGPRRGPSTADVTAALSALRSYAASHTDDMTRLVDTVGGYVDKQTNGRYAQHINRAQAGAKSGINKLKR